jgi:broad specificity phosphatase PhoE
MTLLLASLVPLLSLSQIDQNHIYIIRHGESIYNIPDPSINAQRTTGISLDIPLTENGLKQASELGHRLAERIAPASNVVICSSTAIRAQMTAMQIFEALKDVAHCELDLAYPGLCEASQGKWEGQSKNDPIYQEEMRTWKERSAYDKIHLPRVTTGESFEEVAQRYSIDLETLVKKHAGKTILVVSHYWSMNAYAMKANQVELSTEPRTHFPMLELDNCDIMTVEIDSMTVSGQIRSIL